METKQATDREKETVTAAETEAEQLKTEQCQNTQDYTGPRQDEEGQGWNGQPARSD